MRLLVLYATDLAADSRVAPGGITANVRAYLGELPSDWDIEVWGVSAEACPPRSYREIALSNRSVRLRPLLRAGPAESRRFPLAPRYSLALAKASWPFGLGLQGWDVVIAHRVEYLATLALVVSRRRLPPSVQMIHGSSTASQTAFGPLWGPVHLIAEHLAISRASAVALVSKSSVPYYRQRYPQWAERFHWVANGVSLKRFRNGKRLDWRSRHGFTAEDRLLMYHGRYDPQKCIGRMLEVFRQLICQDNGPWHLVCAGVGPDVRLLREAQSTWGRGRIHELGYLDAQQIVEMLMAGDLALLFSDWEGMSNALLEALAAGLPVVATDVDDNGVVLAHVDSELIGPPDPSVLARKVRWAWEHREELSARARKAGETFSLAARVRRLTSLFEAVAERKALNVISASSVL